MQSAPDKSTASGRCWWMQIIPMFLYSQQSQLTARSLDERTCMSKPRELGGLKPREGIMQNHSFSLFHKLNSASGRKRRELFCPVSSSEVSSSQWVWIFLYADTAAQSAIFLRIKGTAEREENTRENLHIFLWWFSNSIDCFTGGGFFASI